MPLVSIPRLMSDCQAGGYAIGYFESWNLESLQGVLDAAEQTRSPVIVGFNGEFLSHGGRLASERLALYGVLGRAAAESSSVPCGFIFNECPDDSWVLAAMDAGFNLVMPADPSCSHDEYARRVKRIVAHARDRSVAVEAELGELPCGVSGSMESEGQFTDPHEAERFVRRDGSRSAGRQCRKCPHPDDGRIGTGLGAAGRDPRPCARPACPARRNRNHAPLLAGGDWSRRRESKLRDVPQTALPASAPRATDGRGDFSQPARDARNWVDPATCWSPAESQFATPSWNVSPHSAVAGGPDHGGRRVCRESS